MGPMSESLPESTDLAHGNRESAPPAGESVVSWLALRGRGSRINGPGAGDLPGKRGIFHYSACPGGNGASGGCGGPEIAVDLGRWGETGCIVRARRIRPQAGNAPLVRELVDLLHIQLQCLARGMTVRGAVAVGCLRGRPNREHRLSGPALSRARVLAHARALHPLIAVEEDIVGRLRSDDSLWAEDHGLRSEMDVIDAMMTADGAGLHYLDYLSASLGDFDYDFDRYAEFLGRHKRFVEAGLARKPPPAAPETYRWLKIYHNARIDEDISPPGRDVPPDECHRAMAGDLAPLRIA